jgi:hypothetical protein
MTKFPWGRVIERFDYDFDGEKVEVVKYFPKKANHLNMGFEDAPQYHIEDLHESSNSLQYILISWIARKNLGLNQHALVAGVCRALDVK